MFLKKSVLAAGMVAALAVPASFAASNANFGQVISSIQASKTGSHANSKHHGSEERDRR